MCERTSSPDGVAAGARGNISVSLAVRTRGTPTVSDLRPLQDDNFVWLTKDEVIRQQAQLKSSLKASELFSRCTMAASLSRKIVASVPSDRAHQTGDDNWHCGSQVHQGEQPMMTLLCDRFHVDYLSLCASVECLAVDSAQCTSTSA